jgi:hypothetical protein
MPKTSTQTVSLALVEADAAIAVLESALRGKLTEAEARLVTKAREALAVAEGRLNDTRVHASRVLEML